MDKKGNPVSVILNIDIYHKILEELEELAAIRAYDAAKSSDAVCRCAQDGEQCAKAAVGSQWPTTIV